MRFGLRYEDPGADQYEQRYRERVVRQLQRRAALFGLCAQHGRDLRGGSVERKP
jgi:hypothetical protein